MRVIDIINLKGGVAKTISAINIAHVLAAIHPSEPVVPAPAHVDEQRAVRRKQGHVCGDQVDPRDPGWSDHLPDVQPGLGKQLGDAGPVAWWTAGLKPAPTQTRTGSSGNFTK